MAKHNYFRRTRLVVIIQKQNGNVFVSVYLFKGAAESEECILSMSVSAQVFTECSGTYV